MLSFSGVLLFIAIYHNSILSSHFQVDAKRQEKGIFKIAVFYDNTYDSVEDYVSYSVDAINRLLMSSKFQFEYTINRVNKNDSYQVTTKLCSELAEGRIAVLAIGDSPIMLSLFSITSNLQIPFLTIKWDSSEDSTNSIYNFAQKLNMNGDGDAWKDDEKTSNEPKQINQINIHPPASKIIQAIIDLINSYNWDDVVVLYQESMGIGRVEDMIRLPKNQSQHAKLRFQFKSLGSDTKRWVYVLKDVKASGSNHIIVDLQKKYLNEFFNIADEIDIMTSYYHYIFTSFDLDALDYLPSANLSAFQVYEPNNMDVKALLAEFNLKNMVSRKVLFKYMTSEALFIYDSILLLAKTIDKNNLVDSLFAPQVSCDNELPWSFGSQFMKYLKMNNLESVSGHLEFDEDTGYRKNLTLSIVDKTKSGADLVGYWREFTTKSDSSVEITRSFSKSKDLVLDRLKRHLVVLTKLEAPYAMKRVRINNQTLVGNAQYKGYCIDLLEKISKICGFNYTIKLVEDGKHGAFVDGKWNGMVSELINKKADLAVAALTISTVRDAVIDFTNPFLNLGISILFKKPAKKEPDLFSFLSPLSVEVWLYMLAAYIVVSVILFVLARLSPYEWKNNQPCDPDGILLENQWSISNSFWFSMGNLLRQGTNISASVSPSIRLISIVWAFFTLLLISSYTANLAAFLTAQRMQSSIQSVEDLSKQTVVKYGSVGSGSTENFFKTSKIATYERMWNFMSNNPQVIVKSADEGIARVKAGGYAYILESTTNEYVRQRDCELMQVGGLLDTKGYGIATPTGSHWRDILSNAILQLQEKGDLQELYTKWWQIEDIDPNQQCDADSKTDSDSELHLQSVGGVFIVMGFGIILSFIIAFLEFLIKAKKTADYKMPLGHHINRGFRDTFQNFFKAEFETPFPKLERDKKKYDAQIAIAKSESAPSLLSPNVDKQKEKSLESTDLASPDKSLIISDEFVPTSQEKSNKKVLMVNISKRRNAMKEPSNKSSSYHYLSELDRQNYAHQEEAPNKKKVYFI